MHRLLTRQIRRYLQGSPDESLQNFLQAIDLAYQQADEERSMVERSLQLTSQELLDRNQELKDQVDEMHDTQERLSHSHEILTATLNASKEAILVINHDDQPIAFNHCYEELIGLSAEQIANKNGRELFQHTATLIKKPNLLYQQHDELTHVGSESHAEYEAHDGRIVEVIATHHEIAGLVWMLRDISQRRKNEKTIHHQAHHDALTGLPNRILLADRLDQAIHRAHRNRNKVAACYIDLDGFKNINDSLGHNEGDKLLVAVSSRFSSCIREADTLARIGGDEFVIVYEGINSHDEILHMAERILQSVEDPIEIEERSYYIGASIGISMYPNDGEDTNSLLRSADIAMYRAKDNGKNRFQFFTPSLDRIAQHRMAMELQLRDAIKNNELLLHYQPKFLLETTETSGTSHCGKLHSFEALIRWKNKKGEFIPPSAFIPIAEEAGLIGTISEWVLKEACRQAKEWQQAGFHDANISINLSPKEFLIPDFHIKIAQQIKSANIPSHMISIEITESLLMQDLDNAKHVLDYFRDQEIFIYLDDFGTGFSSLNYLKNLPVDAIKIDRTFVKDLGHSQADRAISASIIALGKNLGMMIVAEGIESQQQADYLTSQGCDLAQGFYFGKPVDAITATQFFR